jgi:hypothetical protein
LIDTSPRRSPGSFTLLTRAASSEKSGVVNGDFVAAMVALGVALVGLATGVEVNVGTGVAVGVGVGGAGGAPIGVGTKEGGGGGVAAAAKVRPCPPLLKAEGARSPIAAAAMSTRTSVSRPLGRREERGRRQLPAEGVGSEDSLHRNQLTRKMNTWQGLGE